MLGTTSRAAAGCAAAAAVGVVAYFVLKRRFAVQIVEAATTPLPAATPAEKLAETIATPAAAPVSAPVAKDVSKSPDVQKAPPPASKAPVQQVDSKAAVAALAERVSELENLVARLSASQAGTEERRTTALQLLDALTYVSSTKGKEQRKLVRAFVDAGGPDCIYETESSMTGNWMKDGKNGTLKVLSSMSRLDGAVGAAISAYRRVAEKNKLDAAHQLGCSHQNGQTSLAAVEGESLPPGAVGVLPNGLRRSDQS